jgi:hypothetical protein
MHGLCIGSANHYAIEGGSFRLVQLFELPKFHMTEWTYSRQLTPYCFAV